MALAQLLSKLVNVKHLTIQHYCQGDTSPMTTPCHPVTRVEEAVTQLANLESLTILDSQGFSDAWSEMPWRCRLSAITLRLTNERNDWDTLASTMTYHGLRSLLEMHASSLTEIRIENAVAHPNYHSWYPYGQMYESRPSRYFRTWHEESIATKPEEEWHKVKLVALTSIIIDNEGMSCKDLMQMCRCAKTLNRVNYAVPSEIVRNSLRASELQSLSDWLLSGPNIQEFNLCLFRKGHYEKADDEPLIVKSACEKRRITFALVYRPSAEDLGRSAWHSDGDSDNEAIDADTGGW